MRRRAFTLLEMLFGTAILVIFVLVLFSLFRTSAFQMDKDTWYSGSQGELRAAFQLFRDKAFAASYPATITFAASTIDTASANQAHCISNKDSPLKAPATSDLASWKICDTSRDVPGAPIKAGKTVAVVIRLAGRNIEYVEDGKARVVVKDVDEVEVYPDPKNVAGDLGKGAMIMKVTTLHPNPAFKATKVVQETGLAFRVAVSTP